MSKVTQYQADQAFAADNRGSTSIIFALCVVSLCGMIGGAVDMAMHMRARTAHTEAIDAAALAGARVKQVGGSDDQALARAMDVYLAATQNIGVDGTPTFTIAPDGMSIVGTANLSTPGVFLKAIGVDKINFEVVNKAEFASPTEVEMSLMLDTTGSMGGAKLESLKTAVEQLIDIVIRVDGAGQSRIAIAPFSSAVALKTQQFREATGETTGGGGCVVERAGEVYDDSTPSVGTFITPLPGYGSCKAGEEVFPLTRKKSDLKNMVKSLSAGGSTAGHLGTAWAWYLLSPNWASLFSADEKPKDYSVLTEVLPSGARKLRKIAVLMTDGEYNTSHNGIDATEQARAICERMRKTGIEIYTVGFEVGGSASVIETLQQCASAPANFYLASDGAALQTAFLDIAKKASSVRLSQ